MSQTVVDISKIKDRSVSEAIDTLAATVVGLSASSVSFTVVTKTANYSLLSGDSGKSYNNSGAAGTVILTLPAAVSGLYYMGIVSTAQTLRFTAVGTDIIYIGPIVSAAAGNTSSDVLGSTIRLECHIAGSWVATFLTGDWSIV